MNRLNYDGSPHKNVGLPKTADLAFKDSINTILEDSLLDPSEDEQLSALLDSSLTEPVWYDLFPYLGPKWDMARNYLAVYDSAFINSVKTPGLLHLKQELSLQIPMPLSWTMPVVIL